MNHKSLDIDKRFYLLYFITFLLSLCWVFAVPLDSPDYWSRLGNWFPDEADHLSVVRFWAANGQPPRYGPPFYTSQHPPLYYVLMGLLYRLAGESFFAVRLFSVGLGMLTVLSTSLAARRLVGREVALLATGIVALVPMRLVLSGAASNENLATCGAAATLALLTKMVRQGTRIRWPCLLSVCLVLIPGAKLTGLGLFPAAFPVLARKWGTRNAAGFLLLCGILFVATWAWWFGGNRAHYGDWLLRGAMYRVWNKLQPGYSSLHQATGITLSRYVFAIVATGGRSFWGAFSGVDRFLPIPVYVGLAILHALAFREALRLRRSPRSVRAWWLGAGVYALVLFSIFVAYNVSFFSAQGRYLHGLLVPLSVLLARGWLRPFPPGVRRHAGIVLLGTLFVLNVWCLQAYPPWR